jgi:aminoglycoside phosphotransferase (APT) family kinase protein
MDLEELERQVREALPGLDNPPWRRVDRFALHPMLNYGGFVNRSFKIIADGRAYHLKLSGDAHSRRGLERWRALGDRLADAYRAPTMRGWLRVEGTPFAGPLFDWIDGARPAAVEGAVREGAVEAVRRLHADRGLAAALAELGDGTISCREAYLDTYHDRFVEDLKIVRAEPPPFIDAGLADWLAAEADALAETVAASQPFAAAADAASHRDLWLDNLMVTGDGELFILDWDEMGLGDPMMDWAMLFGPTRERVRPAPVSRLTRLPVTEPERERLRLYARASLLDWIIDPLADWVDAAREPQHGAAVRESNQRVSQKALTLYRELYVR